MKLIIEALLMLCIGISNVFGQSGQVNFRKISKELTSPLLKETHGKILKQSLTGKSFIITIQMPHYYSPSMVRSALNILTHKLEMDVVDRWRYTSSSCTGSMTTAYWSLKRPKPTITLFTYEHCPRILTIKLYR